MSYSQALSTRDVRRAMRLVAETVDLGHDALAWRSRFLEGLLALIGAGSSGMMTVLRYPLAPTSVLLVVNVCAGSSARQLASLGRYLSSGDPVTDPILRMGQRNFSRLRAQMCDDRTCYRSRYHNDVRRPIDCDDLIYSQILLPSLGLASGLGALRALDSPPFNARQRAILHIAHHELARLWSRGLEGPGAALSPRMRRVLDLLCEGQSEKQVAGRLGLAHATVHNYVGMLHRKLDVQSRGELVAVGLRFGRRMGPKVLPD